MTVHVLGLGPTLQHFKPDGNLTIGCNDIFRTVATDFLIVVSRLSPARADIVRASHPKVLLSQMQLWHSHPSWEKLPDLTKWRPNKPNDVSKYLYSSNNTPFIACSYAFKYMGATEIVLWGVDFTDHQYIKDEALKETILAFSQLADALKQKGCNLVLGIKGGNLTLEAWK